MRESHDDGGIEYGKYSLFIFYEHIKPSSNIDKSMNIRVYICTYETLKRVLFILDLSLKQIGLVTFARYTCMVDNMFQCLRDQHNITHAHIYNTLVVLRNQFNST